MPSIRQRFHLSPCSDFRSHFCTRSYRGCNRHPSTTHRNAPAGAHGCRSSNGYAGPRADGGTDRRPGTESDASAHSHTCTHAHSYAGAYCHFYSRTHPHAGATQDL